MFALLAAIVSMKALLVRIPPELLVFCLGLVVLTAVLLARMLAERRRAARACDEFLGAVAGVPAADREERWGGLPDQRMEEICRRCENLDGKPREWWRALEEALEYYTAADGRAGWFLTRPAGEVLPEEEVIEPFYHASFHQAVPGVVTALGLLGTFTAILLALAGVSYDASNAARPVSGIDGLINGLAGKFLSSIVALVLSVAFTFVEKKRCERYLARRYDELIRRMRKLLPYLSQTRILLDIQRGLAAAGREEERDAAGFRQ